MKKIFLVILISLAIFNCRRMIMDKPATISVELIDVYGKVKSLKFSIEGKIESLSKYYGYKAYFKNAKENFNLSIIAQDNGDAQYLYFNLSTIEIDFRFCREDELNFIIGKDDFKKDLKFTDNLASIYIENYFCDSSGFLGKAIILVQELGE